METRSIEQIPGLDETTDANSYRPLLFAIAYRMLGSVAEAEDVVQEAFLRWLREVMRGGHVQTPKAWLSAVVTRLCIDQLRSARVQRETYVGPWLPEPLVTEREPDVADAAVLAESLSMAFLVVLETLNPVERAVFLLYDVFGYEYQEIAGIVDKSAVNCRQIARRARSHVTDHRPRFEHSPVQHQQLATRFLEAIAGGDLPGLLATLANDVAVWSDGGGKARAARRPIHGQDNVARFLLGILHKAPPEMVICPRRINGQPGVVSYLDGRSLGVLTLEILDEQIQTIRIVVNPDKLRAIPS